MVAMRVQWEIADRSAVRVESGVHGQSFVIVFGRKLVGIFVVTGCTEGFRDLAVLVFKNVTRGFTLQADNIVGSHHLSPSSSLPLRLPEMLPNGHQIWIILNFEFLIFNSGARRGEWRRSISFTKRGMLLLLDSVV